jgi:hypothetical protein
MKADIIACSPLFLRNATDRLSLLAMKYPTIATALLPSTIFAVMPAAQAPQAVARASVEFPLSPVPAPVPTFKEVTGPGPMSTALQRLPADDGWLSPAYKEMILADAMKVNSWN